MRQSRPCGRWSAPPADLRLADEEVHVWQATLDLRPARVRALAHTLSEDERVRAGRFVFERDRSRFIARRGLLRAILGRYLRKAPGELEFRARPYGKPAVSPGAGGSPLRFSASHADGMALFAVTAGREVGVDLERVRSDFPYEDVAGRVFSPREAQTLLALNAISRPIAFFNCWTRKEAYLKARGVGLSLPLDQFDVSLVPGEPAAFLRAADDPHAASRWSLHDLPPGPGYAGAVAVEGPSARLRCWQWPDAS
jgi:4'-phosphopantetheinyl transferase